MHSMHVSAYHSEVQFNETRTEGPLNLPHDFLSESSVLPNQTFLLSKSSFLPNLASFSWPRQWPEHGPWLRPWLRPQVWGCWAAEDPRMKVLTRPRKVKKEDATGWARHLLYVVSVSGLVVGSLLYRLWTSPILVMIQPTRAERSVFFAFPF